MSSACRHQVPRSSTRSSLHINGQGLCSGFCLFTLHVGSRLGETVMGSGTLKGHVDHPDFRFLADPGRMIGLT